MNLSQYLYHHKNGNYYFRIRTPDELIHVIKTKEFKRSLGTKNKVIASRNALPYLSFIAKIQSTMDINKLLKDLESGHFSGLGVKGLEFGNLKIAELEIDPQKEGDVDAAINFLKGSVVAQEGISPPRGDNTPENSQVLLKDAIKHFEQEKRTADTCKESTLKENHNIYQFLLRIFGDEISVAELSFDTGIQTKETLAQLPTHINKTPKYRGKTLPEIIAYDDPTISVTTINKYLTKYIELFGYLKRHHYIAENYFEGLLIRTGNKNKRGKGKRQKRVAFTPEQLITIFTTLNEQTHKRSFEYWLPRIVLYTGMRLNEMCQLHLDDIYKKDGIYVFDVNDDEEKSLKNESSIRIIPIHSKLIEIGLIKRVEELRLNNEKRLFPELKFNGEDYQREASRWFTEVRRPLGWVNLKPMLDFHSYRHNVTTDLQQSDIPEYRVAAILGHEVGSGESFQRYGKGFKTSTVKADIELLEYHDPQIHISPPIIKKKAPRKRYLKK